MPGGRYSPLSDVEITAIHRTSLTILEDIGIGSPTPQIIELTTAKGAFLSPLGRLCFPRTLIEEVIQVANKEFTHHAADEAKSIHLHGEKVHFRT